MVKMITIRNLIILLLTGCFGQSKEKSFLAKYELEDFSQFNGVEMILRGVDKHGNLCVFGYAPHLVNDSSKVGAYFITLDRESYQIIEIGFISTEYYDNADTLQLQQLAQRFMQYEIPRLYVDEQGNVSIYLKDFETLAMVRFANENELQKRSKETKWKNIKSNWYKPK